MPYILWCFYVGCIYIYNYYVLWEWTLDRYIVSLVSSYNSLCFKVYFVCFEYSYSYSLWFPFTWNTFSHPLTLRLQISIGLRSVSCRQSICRSYFCIYPASLCCLLVTFNPFVYKVLIDMYDPITIFLVVWCLFFVGLFLLCVYCLEKFL